jgi:hypothetical protein
LNLYRGRTHFGNADQGGTVTGYTGDGDSVVVVVTMYVVVYDTTDECRWKGVSSFQVETKGVSVSDVGRK